MDAIADFEFNVNLYFYLPTEKSKKPRPTEGHPTPTEGEPKGKPTLILTIPLQTCHNFSRKPLKWLRYLGYTLYGREGDICMKGERQPVNYEISVLELRDHDYYFHSPGAPFIFDVDAYKDRVTTSTGTTRRAGFRDDLIKRDIVCILTGTRNLRHVTAMHIIPHSKGNEYLYHLCNYRGQGLVNDFEAIDDIRNGFLGHVGYHIWFADGGFAFLRVPNFALEYGDIEIAPNETFLRADTQPCPLPSPTDKVRYIIQHFDRGDDPVLPNAVPHNAMARLFDLPDSPHTLITDLWYGCCAFKKWGVHGVVVEELKRLAGDTYYDINNGNGGNNNDDNGSQNQDRQATPVQRDTGISSSQQQTWSRKRARQEDSDTIDPHSPEILSAMDFVSTLWLSAPRDVIERRQEQRRQAEKEESELSTSRVLGWMETMNRS